MGCQEIAEQFSDFLDGTLSHDQETLVNDHLAQCTRCEHSFQILKATLHLLPSYPRIEVSSNFEQKLWARIQRSEPTLWEKISGLVRLPDFSGNIFSPAMAMVTALIVIASLAVMMRGYLQPASGGSNGVIAEDIAPTAKKNAVPLAENPLAASVSSGSKRYVMPRISPEQFNQSQPRLLRGAGSGDWTDDSRNSRFVIKSVRPDDLRADSTRVPSLDEHPSTTELRF